LIGNILGKRRLEDLDGDENLILRVFSGIIVRVRNRFQLCEFILIVLEAKMSRLLLNGVERFIV
jgi:hypothetical protein